MKQGMRRFLMICGIVVSVGMLLSLTGWLLGGVKGLSGVEDKVRWVSFGGGGLEFRDFAVEDFSAVDVECDMGDVEFIEGEKFIVETSYEKKLEAPGVEVKNGTLYVTPQKNRRWWFDLGIFGKPSYEDTTIKIYYPKGTVFKNVKVETNMGDAKLSGLQAERVDIVSDYGDLELNGLTADFLRLEASMGNAAGREMQTKGADIQCDMGEVELAGAFAGTTKIRCDMGSCELDTHLDKNSYAIHTEVDMGECTIDGEEVGDTHTVVNAEAKNKLNVESDSGDIEINFR